MIFRATIDAIELAWTEKGRAQDVALRFKVTKNQVRRIWSIAKAAGRLPNIERRRGGYDFEAMLEARTKAQALNASIPPFTTQAPARVMKENAA